MNLWGKETHWQERLDRLGEEILFWNPDVVCLQEVRQYGTAKSTAELLAAHIGYTVAAESDAPYSTAVLSALPVLGGGNIIFESYEEMMWWDTASYASLQSPSGRVWHVGSLHLGWGPNIAAGRLHQCETMVTRMQELTAAYGETEQGCVLAGDFNTVPDSPAIDYLTGRGLGEPGTLWVDAWEKAGDGNGYTSDPNNMWHQFSAEEVGIGHPNWVPPRRIDYVFSGGYAHGRPGTPVQAHLVGLQRGQTPPPSDHYGVLADLWDPPISRS